MANIHVYLIMILYTKIGVVLKNTCTSEYTHDTRENKYEAYR